MHCYRTHCVRNDGQEDQYLIAHLCSTFTISSHTRHRSAPVWVIHPGAFICHTLGDLAKANTGSVVAASQLAHLCLVFQGAAFAPQPNCKFNLDADISHRFGYALWAPVN